MSQRYKWFTTARTGLIIDTPGAMNITLKPDGRSNDIQYAGLTFTEQITASILQDGTLVVAEQGVRGKDAEGNTWVSQTCEIDGKEAIAFFPPKSGNPPAGTQTATPAQLLPPFKERLQGRNPVRIRNPNAFAVAAGIRAGGKGRNFDVHAKGVKTVYIPDGRYDIYFVYSDKPDALFQGDPFTLNNNGLEIQIVKVVDGNYGIRQVK